MREGKGVCVLGRGMCGVWLESVCTQMVEITLDHGKDGNFMGVGAWVEG